MSNQSYDFNLSVGIQEILDADSAARVESQVEKQKQRMEEPVEIKVELNIGDAKKQIKELQKEMTVAANNIKKIQSKKKGLGKSDYNDIAKYNSLLDSNQRKIDVIVGQLKSQGETVRSTTKEYKELQAALEDIGYVEKKKKTSAPRKQATSEVKKQTEAEKEHTKIAKDAVEATNDIIDASKEQAKSMQKDADAIDAKTAAIEKQADATKKLAKAQKEVASNSTVKFNKAQLDKASFAITRSKDKSLGSDVNTEDMKDVLEEFPDLVASMEDGQKTLKNGLKSVEEMVSRISKNASISGVAFGDMYHVAAEVGKQLSTMYDDGIRDTEEYITLQYKLMNIIDKRIKSVGGVRVFDEKNRYNVEQHIFDAIQQDTGYDIRSGSAIDAIWGQGEYSIFQKLGNRTIKRSMRSMAGDLLNYKSPMEDHGVGGHWVDLDYERLTEINKVLGFIRNNMQGIAGAQSSTHKFKAETKAIEENTKAVEKNIDAKKTGNDIKSDASARESGVDLLNDILDQHEEQEKRHRAEQDKLEARVRKQADEAAAAYKGRGATYEGDLYHASKKQLSDITYDPAKGIARRTLGQGLYTSPYLEQVKDYGENIIKQSVQLKNVFTLIEGGISDINALYLAMGKTAPEVVDWDKVVSDLTAFLETSHGVEDFTKRMKSMGYDAMLSQGYGARGKDSPAQIAIYDEKYWKNLSTVPYAEMKTPAESAAVAQEKLVEANKDVASSADQATQKIEEHTNALREQKIVLPNLTAAEHKAVFGDGAVDNLLKNYNISGNDANIVFDKFRKLAQIEKAVNEDVDNNDAANFDQLNGQFNNCIQEIVSDLIRFGSTVEGSDTYLQEFFNYMKGQKIRYDDSDRAEFSSDWGSTRKRFGKYLTQSPSALPADVIYMEALDMFPGLFDAEIINPQEQLKEILSALGRAMDAKKSDFNILKSLSDEDRYDVEYDVQNLALKMTDRIRLSAEALETERGIADAVETTNEARREGVGIIKKTNDELHQIEDDSKPIDANWILKRDEAAAITRSRLADANITPVVNLSGIYNTEQLESEMREAANKIVDSNDLTFGKLHIDGSIASIKLFNKELGKTVVDWYEVKEATEDATKSELQYLKSTLDHDAEAARKYTEAQDKKVEDGHNWLIQQLGKLDSREVAYKYSSKKISGNTEIWNEDHDEKYWGKTIDELAGEIRGKLQGAIGGAISEPFKNEIRDAMRVLDMEIKVEQSKQYVSGKLSAQQAQDAKATHAYELEKFTKKAQRNNVLPQLQADIDAMQAELDSVTENCTDGLNRFVDKMRIANAHFEAEMETVQGDQKEQRNYKKAEQAQTRLYNARKQLAKLEAEGKTDAELSRRVTELEKEYDVTSNLLKTEKSMGDILERQATLETELENVRKQAQADYTAKQRAQEEKQFNNQLRSYFTEWVNIQKEINGLDTQINSLTLKDKGTGTYSSQIEDIQTLKSGKIADIRTLENQINKTMSVIDADYTGGFVGFLEYCRENAIAAAEEIEDLNKVMMQSEHIEQNFNIDSAKQKQEDQKKKYEELLRLQKKYNDTDYKWHQADITGADKSTYNSLLTSYKNSMQELRKEIELTTEQQAEFDRRNNEHNARKEKLLNNTEFIDLQKEIRAADEVRKSQNKLYEAKMQLAKLEAKGDMESANWQKASRLVEEYDEQYQATLKTLHSTERINAALEREIRLADEVSKLTQDSADKKAKEQSDAESKQYYAAQNERLKAYAQYGYQYNSQYGYNDVRGKTAADQTMLDSMSEYYKQEEIKAEQFANNIKSTYDTILSITKQINDLDVKMNDLSTKDKGSGLYSGWINNLQTQKSGLVADMRQLMSEIAESMSVEPSHALHAFFERAQQDAVLTTEDVQKFNDALVQAENIKFNFGAKVAEQTAPVIEKIAHLKQMMDDGLITDEGTKLNVASISTTLNNKYNAFKSSGSQADAIDFLKYANEVSEYISQLDTAAQKEAQYFKSKKQYEYSAEGTGGAIEGLDKSRQALEKYVQGFEDGKAVITGFSTSVDGISKIDFSWLDESTGQFHTFYAEMGKFTDDIHTYEATMKNMSSGTDAANATLLQFAQTLEKLNGMEGVDNIRDNLVAQMKELSKANAEVGSSKDLGEQLGLKNKAEGAEKSLKAIIKLIDEINSGNLINLGNIDQSGDVFAQMYAKIRDSAADATVSNVKFDEVTNTMTYTITKANGEVQELSANMDKLGNVTAKIIKSGKKNAWWQDLGGALGGVGKEALRYGANMLQVMDIIRYLRQGFNEVKEIDTALTELRKVTDETEATYQNFLQTMSKTGAAVGSTVKDLTTSAADWARLGYSIEEAGKLAENTMILMNVSEFDNVSDATDSMISAIQAFKGSNTDIGTFSMEIIDVFNQIGKIIA